MFAKKIVVAYNDTDLSNDLLDYVHGILELNGEIQLNLIYSYEERIENATPYKTGVDDGVEAMESHAAKIIAKGKSKFDDLPNTVEGFVYNCSPANAILDHAKESEADLIVIGNRGFSGLREFVSSVSRTVQSKSHIPVLTFPKYAPEELEQHK